MKKKFKLSPMLLLAIAAVLLLVSTVGSTQAALLYYSDNYVATVETFDIGTVLVENGNPMEGDTALLGNLLGDDTKLVPGKTYDEVIQVANSGQIDSYVRVLIRKYWLDESGKKASDKLDPSYIELIPSASDKWVKSHDSTAEREIFYYKDILKTSETNKKEMTDAVIDGIKINGAILKEVIQHTNGNKISYEYKYDGCKFVVEVEAQAIQTHNAVDAIKSAWGVNATIEDGVLTVN